MRRCSKLGGEIFPTFKILFFQAKNTLCLRDYKMAALPQGPSASLLHREGGPRLGPPFRGLLGRVLPLLGSRHRDPFVTGSSLCDRQLCSWGSLQNITGSEGKIRKIIESE